MAIDTREPFVDSSNAANRSGSNPKKRHAHLRPFSSHGSTSPSKSPPTCTLSLANATTKTLITFPLSPPSFVPFPCDDAGSCGEMDFVVPLPVRQRARTSHVETPRSSQPQPQTSPKQRRNRSNRISKERSLSPTIAQTKTPSPADLRLAALVERSIALNSASRPSSRSVSDLDQQDSLLGARLRALLVRHGRRIRPPSPIGIVPPACAPTPVLLSGASSDISHDIATKPSSGLQFVVTRPGRSRSSSRGSIHGENAELELPALVATLLLRRHEGSTRSGSPVLRPYTKRALPSSKLGKEILSAS